MTFPYARIVVPFAQIGFELILVCSTQPYLRWVLFCRLSLLLFLFRFI